MCSLLGCCCKGLGQFCWSSVLQALHCRCVHHCIIHEVAYSTHYFLTKCVINITEWYWCRFQGKQHAWRNSSQGRPRQRWWTSKEAVAQDVASLVWEKSSQSLKIRVSCDYRAIWNGERRWCSFGWFTNIFGSDQFKPPDMHMANAALYTSRYRLIYLKW